MRCAQKTKAKSRSTLRVHVRCAQKTKDKSISTHRDTWSKRQAEAMRPVRRVGWVWAESCAPAQQKKAAWAECTCAGAAHTHFSLIGRGSLNHSYSCCARGFRRDGQKATCMGGLGVEKSPQSDPERKKIPLPRDASLETPFIGSPVCECKNFIFWCASPLRTTKQSPGG